MKSPLHRFEIETDSDEELDRHIRREIHSLPTSVQREFSDAERFGFQLILEEYVVGLLKEMQAVALRTRHRMTVGNRLVVVFEKRLITISFNGQEKVLHYPPGKGSNS